ncbi:MAG TPA: hypothetical protein VGP59_07155 [Pyrinomonadaceae bacterium]|nr:hypothetical protein [Pyrinomonadaceae bacterium]
MKIPLKYGLIATLGVAAWVLTTHSLIADPKSAVHTLGAPIFFNIFHFAVIYLGLKALEREKGDRLIFKELLKTGVGISVVYALTVSLFFAGIIMVVGTKWLPAEPTAVQADMSRVIIGSFVGMFIGALVFGVIYSTLISFFLAKRRSDVS